MIDYLSRLWAAFEDLFSALGGILALLIGGIVILLAIAMWLWAIWFCFFEKAKKGLPWELLPVQVILTAALFGLPAGSTHHSYAAFFAGTSIGLIGWLLKAWRFGLSSGAERPTKDQQSSS